MRPGALAIFVKTPGLTPVKTRLAADLGSAFAEEFYRRALIVTEDLAGSLASETGIQPYWAVAEPESSQSWASFPNVFQGNGGLGTRLARVYEELLSRHDYVAFLGADSPHVPISRLVAALKGLENCDFIMGRAADGGFYFFAGKRPVPREIWTAVPYSTEWTARELSMRLETLGTLAWAEADFDIDTAEDLVRYRLLDTQGLSPKQMELLNWIRSSKLAQLPKL